MQLFFFTKYTRAGPSSRYRTFQYLLTLEAAGLRFTVSPLFSDAYLAHKYAQGRPRISDVICAFAQRLWAVLTLPSETLVVIEYELLPWFPAVLERWLAWRGCRMVVDYDDALFHQYDSHPNMWVRRLLGGKIGTVMRLAHTVVAGNAYLAEYALRAGALRVDVIPTVIDLAGYPVKDIDSTSEVFTIGWIGSPSTAGYLRDIAPALARVCMDGRARVRIIGSGPIELPSVPVEIVAWREETEVNEIRGFDVGIMPLPDEPWARGKCGFKLIQYMACGLPVVASPVGVNTEIVTEGISGHLANSIDEWVDALQTLQDDKETRQSMGHEGRQRVKNRYCLQVTANLWVELLKKLHNTASEEKRNV